MLQYIARRVMLMIPTVFLISVVSFVLIQLPPGDYLTSIVATMQQSGDHLTQEALDRLKREYGLGQPIYVQYAKWMWGIFSRGSFGRSFFWNRPVTELIADRLAVTVILTLTTMIFTWVLALPIGIYSATHQYSKLDYLFTSISFIGLATPDFLLALILIWLAVVYLNQNMAGLFSPEYADAPWSLARLIDMFKHIAVPMIISGTSGTAGLVRVMRGSLLDELNKPYVITARAKGLSENRLLFKYPVRVAINPFVSTIGWSLATLFSGGTIVGVVLGLPTIGPLLLSALMAQDMYLAGSILFIISILTVIGTLISDMLLAWVDPRIRFEGGTR